MKTDGQTDKRDWSWIKDWMPGVSQLVATKRKELGNAYISECWHRGVVCGEPGWFFASERSLHIGELWPLAMTALIDARAISDQIPGAAGSPLLILRDMEVKNGKA